MSDSKNGVTDLLGGSLMLLDQFETYLIKNNRAKATIRTRINQIRNFQAHNPDLLLVNAIDILAFLSPQRRRLSDAYRDSLLDGLRVFYGWATDLGLISINPTLDVPSIKFRPEIKPAMPREQVLDLFKVADHTERTILSLAYLQMMRLSEIAQAHPKDRNGPYLQVQGKGGKVRTIPLAKTTLSNLITLEKIQGRKSYYFPGRFSGHLHSATIYKWIKQRVGPDWSTHSFRRSGAVHAYENGASLRVLQEILGHQSLETTQQYLSVTQESLRDAIAGIDIGQNEPHSLSGKPSTLSDNEMLTAIYKAIASQKLIA